MCDRVEDHLATAKYVAILVRADPDCSMANEHRPPTVARLREIFHAAVGNSNEDWIQWSPTIRIDHFGLNCSAAEASSTSVLTEHLSDDNTGVRPLSRNRQEVVAHPHPWLFGQYRR